jgi:hypothetical protein
MSTTFSRVRIADLAERGPNLVGRGSRMTERCFQSQRPFDTLVSIGPINPPSRWPAMIHLLGRDPNLKTPCQYAARCVRLRLRLAKALLGNDAWGFVGQVGERVDLAPDWAGRHQWPCDYQSAIREPRPTNGAASKHLSRFTFHFSRLAYVCS